ncbi:MAG: exodeoxyribonuclease III [Pseudomonadota bacterium]
MRIASFNINGVKARLPALLDWLETSAPDVAALQELKSLDDAFPRSEIEALGYHVETHGQKSFNGVAILSKRPIEDVRRGLPGDPEDAQARWIEAVISGEGRAIRVCGLYLPNGNPVGVPADATEGFSDKYLYKLAWMARLEARARELLDGEEIAVMLGDYNVIPQAEDVARPEDWRDDALFRPESRAAFRRLLTLGYTDAIRAVRPVGERYSFWDYQAGAWRKNDGIAIDHLLLTPQAADLLTDAWVEKAVRGGEKPSDHTPVWCDLNL